MPEASARMEKFFSEVDSKLSSCYEVADKARSKGFDPEDKVDIQLQYRIVKHYHQLA